jgi:hypothetical protein
MEKTVQVAMPNQPMVQDTSDGNTVSITYSGRRYLVVSTSKVDNVVQCVEGSFDSLDAFDLSDFVDDKTNFHVLDADVHTAIAAWLTENYTNEEVANYEETLPTGEIYNYPYSTEGIIDVIWDDCDFVYDSATGNYSGLEYQKPITQEQWDTSIQLNKEWIESVDTATLSEEQAAEFATFSDWYTNVATTYAGVDYWKIPQPSRPRI